MFDYYYGNEAEQFSFLRVPKFLFTHKTFASMSCDAKILYSLMLDRMSLSVKNNWLDEENRVYIIFTQDEARQCMNCGNDKCVKIFNELEEIGLISRKKRGMGRPALIYVKNFVIICCVYVCSQTFWQSAPLEIYDRQNDYSLFFIPIIFTFFIPNQSTIKQHSTNC